MLENAYLGMVTWAAGTEMVNSFFFFFEGLEQKEERQATNPFCDASTLPVVL